MSYELYIYIYLIDLQLFLVNCLQVAIRGVHKKEKPKNKLKPAKLLPKFWFGFGFHFIKTENFGFGFNGRFVCTKPAETKSNYIIIYYILHI